MTSVCARVTRQQSTFPKLTLILERTSVLTGQPSRFVQPTDAVMDNARSPSQIPKFLLKTTLIDFCNNTAAAQSLTPNIQAVRLQNHYAETLWNKQTVTSQVQLHLCSLDAWLLVGTHTRANVDYRRCSMC